MLPPEMIQRILLFCDGSTLCKARRVCKSWKEAADYLINKRDQLSVCCGREVEPATLSELTAVLPDRGLLYRAWHRHGRLAGWPVTTMAPLEMLAPAVVTVTCINGDCMVVAASSTSVGMFDLFGNLLYELPCCGYRFPISQLAVSRPPGGSPRRRLLAIGYDNNLVRVAGLWHDNPPSMVPPVPLRTRVGTDMAVSACEDLVTVCYRGEAWLYRVRLDEASIDVSTVCVVDLSSPDGMWARASCCRTKLAFLTVRTGSPVWCDARESPAANMFCTLPYPLMRLAPRAPPPGEQRDPPAAAIHPDDIQAMHFNTVNVVMSLGAEVVLGHVESGCRTLDAFTPLRSRVTACLLHGRLLLLGTENGTLAVYVVSGERTLPDVDLRRPAGRLQLACEPLHQLFVVDQSATVRVLAQDASGCLHHCFWRRPGAGYRPARQPHEPLQPRWLLFPADAPPEGR